jgi:HisJ family histidinol phosphate phosphatase
VDPPRSKGSRTLSDRRITVIPDIHGHAKGEHRPFAEERPISYSARMLFLWFYHACRRGSPRFMMVSDHVNYLTFEDPGAVHTVRRALKLAHAGDLYGAAETAGVDVAHASVVSEGLRRGMRFSIGAEVDNDPRARPDAQNIVEAMRPDGIIRTVHFITIDHPEKGSDWAWQIDNAEFAHLFEHVGGEKTWELYITKLLDDVEKLPGNVVGNFYLPATFGHWPAAKHLEAYEDKMLEAAHARGMAVEINTRFLYRDNPEDQRQKYIDAISRLMRKAHAKGVGIAIGSAAHSPKDQGNGFEIVLPLLDAFKINEVVFPVAGRLARVVLRATREHLEQHEKRRDTVNPGSSITGFSRAELGLPEEIPVPAKARAARAVGPKKRPADASRPVKRAETSASTAKSTSKRSAESSTSSSKAKAARGKTDEAATPKKAPAKAAAPAKPAAVKPAPAAKVKAAKPAAAPAPKAAKGKPAAKAAPAPAKKTAVKTPAPKPTVPKKAAAAKPSAKPAPVKAVAAKKPAPKKAAPVPAKKAAVAKKTVVKKPPAKIAAKPKKPAAKPAVKPVAKKPAKKVAKPAAKRR